MSKPQYPSLQQAAATAMMASEVGDEVEIHTETCTYSSLGCNCTPDRLILTESGWQDAIPPSEGPVV